MKKFFYQIFTDGSCHGNPGPGGYAGIVRVLTEPARHLHETLEIAGHSKGHTTNNQMELTAVIASLEAIPPGAKATVCTDSNYVKNGITQWIRGWRRNNWKTANKTPVKNQELWRKLDTLNSARMVEWVWVAGHSGHPLNEQVDRMANEQTEFAKAYLASAKISGQKRKAADEELLAALAQDLNTNTKVPPGGSHKKVKYLPPSAVIEKK